MWVLVSRSVRILVNCKCTLNAHWVNINPIYLDWVPILHPPAVFSLFEAWFFSESEDVKENRVKCTLNIHWLNEVDQGWPSLDKVDQSWLRLNPLKLLVDQGSILCETKKYLLFFWLKKIQKKIWIYLYLGGWVDSERVKVKIYKKNTKNMPLKSILDQFKSF